MILYVFKKRKTGHVHTHRMIHHLFIFESTARLLHILYINYKKNLIEKIITTYGTNVNCTQQKEKIVNCTQ